jgi:hypothetical protein
MNRKRGKSQNHKRARYASSTKWPINAPAVVISGRQFAELERKFGIAIASSHRELIQCGVDDYMVLQTSYWQAPSYRSVKPRLSAISKAAKTLHRQLQPLLEPATERDIGCLTEIDAAAQFQGGGHVTSDWLSTLAMSVERLQTLTDHVIAEKNSERSGRKQSHPYLYQLILPLAEVFAATGRTPTAFKSEHHISTNDEIDYDEWGTDFVRFVRAVLLLLPSKFRVPASSLGLRTNDALRQLKNWRLPFPWCGDGILENSLGSRFPSKKRRRK